MKMQRYYSDRESYGPEFDDRLIRLVRENPAIYDVNHQHYRRNPVRVAIWERIATELGAPSKFLQTKWKNIRYNYLQEIKCLETGHTNTNIRKRRFTEDLSFLQYTAQTYNVKKGSSIKNASYNSSDNDSNSYLFSDEPPNAYEVIEIEHSDDDSQHEVPSNVDTNGNNATDQLKSIKTKDEKPVVPLPEKNNEKVSSVTSKLTKNKKPTLPMTYDNDNPMLASPPPPPLANSTSYPASPPLLTPLVIMGNGEDHQEDQENQENSEITIKPIPKQTSTTSTTTIQRIRSSPTVPPKDIMANAAKRKAMQAPFPVLTPINDPIELYCLSLVDSLRNMPRTERERVKYEFAKILKDAKYKDQS